MLIKWNELYSVQVAELDAQHQKLVSIINSLVEQHGQGKLLECAPIFKELNEYALYHLATEEKYFAQFKYDASSEHIKQHDVYRAKIKELEQGCLLQNEEAFSELFNFLKDWWINHINHVDIKYGDFFNDHGLY